MCWLHTLFSPSSSRDLFPTLTLMANSALGMMYMHLTGHNQLFAHCPKILLGNMPGPSSTANPASTAGRIISGFWGAEILLSCLVCGCGWS